MNSGGKPGQKKAPSRRFFSTFEAAPHIAPELGTDFKPRRRDLPRRANAHGAHHSVKHVEVFHHGWLQPRERSR